jgi:hypothetical protein
MEVYDWVEIFKGVRTNFDDERCELPSTATCAAEGKELIDKRIRDNRRISTDQTTSEHQHQ